VRFAPSRIARVTSSAAAVDRRLLGLSQEILYNLDVAENRDFFVGTKGLLVHDFSFVQPVLEPFDRKPELVTQASMSK
jgi:hypothetical protein